MLHLHRTDDQGSADPGPYVYAKVDDLEGDAKVGSKECVALVQEYAGVPHHSLWQEGAHVRGLISLTKGTAIATFVGGKYQSHAHGNHAALYIRQDATGIWVMDQWRDDKVKPTISARHLPFRGKDENGNYIKPSNNGDAFSVIN